MKIEDDYPRVAGSADGDGYHRPVPLPEATREGFEAVAPAVETFDENEHSRRYAAVDILVALIRSGELRSDPPLSLPALAGFALRAAAVIYPVSLEVTNK